MANGAVVITDYVTGLNVYEEGKDYLKYNFSDLKKDFERNNYEVPFCEDDEEILKTNLVDYISFSYYSTRVAKANSEGEFDSNLLKSAPNPAPIVLIKVASSSFFKISCKETFSLFNTLPLKGKIA